MFYVEIGIGSADVESLGDGWKNPQSVFQAICDYTEKNLRLWIDSNYTADYRIIARVTNGHSNEIAITDIEDEDEDFMDEFSRAAEDLFREVTAEAFTEICDHPRKYKAR